MNYVLGLFLMVAGFFLLLFGSRLYGQPRVRDRVGYWYHTFPDFDEAPQTFYTRVYQTLRASLQDKEVALYAFGFGPTRFFATASLLAERPLYLQVRYKHLSYYLYAGQTPAGLFVSTWLYDKYLLGETGLLAPTRKAWRYFSTQTLFEHDAAYMFYFSVQKIVADVLNGYLEEKGLQPMEEYETRPILHAFYQHPFAHDPYFRGNGFPKGSQAGVHAGVQGGVPSGTQGAVQAAPAGFNGNNGVRTNSSTVRETSETKTSTDFPSKSAASPNGEMRYSDASRNGVVSAAGTSAVTVSGLAPEPAAPEPLFDLDPSPFTASADSVAGTDGVDTEEGSTNGTNRNPAPTYDESVDEAAANGGSVEEGASDGEAVDGEAVHGEAPR